MRGKGQAMKMRRVAMRTLPQTLQLFVRVNRANDGTRTVKILENELAARLTRGAPAADRIDLKLHRVRRCALAPRNTHSNIKIITKAHLSVILPRVYLRSKGQAMLERTAKTQLVSSKSPLHRRNRGSKSGNKSSMPTLDATERVAKTEGAQAAISSDECRPPRLLDGTAGSQYSKGTVEILSPSKTRSLNHP